MQTGLTAVNVLFFEDLESQKRGIYASLGLELRDLRLILEGEPDIVETVQKAVFAERVDLERHEHRTIRNSLSIEIDAQRKAGIRRRPVHHFGDH